MSDAGDVNRAHMNSPLDAYVESAKRVSHPEATMPERLAFLSYHSARNVVALGKLIDELREENRKLMEQLYGGLDTSE